MEENTTKRKVKTPEEKIADIEKRIEHYKEMIVALQQKKKGHHQAAKAQAARDQEDGAGFLEDAGGRRRAYRGGSAAELGEVCGHKIRRERRMFYPLFSFAIGWMPSFRAMSAGMGWLAQSAQSL